VITLEKRKKSPVKILLLPQISHLSVKSHSGIAPDPSFQPRVGSPVLPRMDTYPRGLVDSWASNTPPC
jgi:hypothetical protein